MTNAQTNRQPRGTSTGGQFAPNQNPESVVDLSDSPTPREVVFDVEYHELDGFEHEVLLARDRDDAVEKTIKKRNLHPRDIVEVTERDETLGAIRHEALWPHGEVLAEERGHRFVTESMLEGIPDLYDTESTPLAEKIVHAHYFSSNGDWYVTELDKEDGTAFGHCDLGLGFPEWGYVNLIELEEVRDPHFSAMPAVERDLHFEPKTVKELGL